MPLSVICNVCGKEFIHEVALMEIPKEGGIIMALNVMCNVCGKPYIQADRYKNWPKGAPHCPHCFKEWKITAEMGKEHLQKLIDEGLELSKKMHSVAKEIERLSKQGKK